MKIFSLMCDSSSLSLVCYTSQHCKLAHILTQVIPESGINICRVGSLDIIAGGVGVAVDGGIETPPAGIPLVATCAVRGMLCGRFLCNLGDLNQDPRISLKTNYNLTYLIGK